MSEMAEKLLKAIQAEENTVPPLHLEGRYVGPRTDAERATLRHCAGDRELIDLYRDLADQAQYYEGGTDPQLRVAAKARLEVIEKVLRNRARSYGLEVGQ